MPLISIVVLVFGGLDVYLPHDCYQLEQPFGKLPVWIYLLGVGLYSENHLLGYVV